MLPPHLKSATSGPDPAPAPKNPLPLLRHNQSFQTALRLFQEDLSAGRYDPTWLKDAAAASAKRAAGDFDEWKEQNREKFWGQKQKVDWRALAGDSGQHTLADVARAGVVELGDVWVLYRALGRGKGAVVVEKEAKVSLSHPVTIHRVMCVDGRTADDGDENSGRRCVRRRPAHVHVPARPAQAVGARAAAGH